MHSGLRNLYLLVSGDCNLDCSYCYAHGGRIGDGPLTMSADVLRLALEKLVPHNGSLVVSFFGGEPLLELDLLRQAVDWGNALGAARGTRMRYAMTTNGTLIDEPRLRFLKDHISYLAVSLDGQPALTDSCRHFRSGEGSVGNKVEQSLESLRNAGIAFGLRATITEKNAEHLADAAAYLQDLSPASLRIDAASGKEWSREGWHVWTARVRQLNRHSFARLIAGETAVPLGDIYRVAALRLADEKRYYPCLAGRGILAVDTAGDAYPCDHFVGEVDFRMGNVKDADFPSTAFCRISDRFIANEVDRRQQCAVCNIRYSCGGECPAISMKRQGNIAEPSPNHCRHMRHVLRDAAKLVDAALSDPSARPRIETLVGIPR